MKPIDDKKETVTFRAVSGNEEGRKRVEKIEISTHNIDKLKYVEKKLLNKGVARMDRHPVDGLGGIGRPPPKSGHGGKYTWEGPGDFAENELEAEPAIDEKDPNYVDEEKEEKLVKGREPDVAGSVVGVVEVPKVAEEGVGRVDLDPRLVAH